MQGSGIANVDLAAVEIKLQHDGFYTLSIGATDMGTGCDTILAQMAAECLDCSVDQVVTQGVDTDYSPYDTGSYASATTYVTGMAVVKACEILRKQIIEEAKIPWKSILLTSHLMETRSKQSKIKKKCCCGNLPTAALPAEKGKHRLPVLLMYPRLPLRHSWPVLRKSM